MRSNLLLTLPFLIFNLVFFVAPTVIIILYSFLEKGDYGGIKYAFTLNAYKESLDPNYFRIFLKTFTLSLLITFLALAVSLPAVYHIVRSRFREVLLTILLLPFWINLILRIYALITLLGAQGIINTFLQEAGLTKSPITFLYNDGAVLLVTAYTFIPYAILPLYSAMDKFDFQLLQAARDLGATHMRSLFFIMLPVIRPAILTAFLFTFVPVMGSYAVAQLVGGKDSLYLGNLVGQQISVLRNWPLASAISIQLLFLSFIALLLLKRITKPGGARVGN